MKYMVFVMLLWVKDSSLASYTPPRIIRDFFENDIIVNANSNFNITCEGELLNLKWIYPIPLDVDGKRQKQKHNWTTFNITNEYFTEYPDFIQRSTLHIYNITYPFVGYYSCQYENNDDQDQVYVYVNDTEHLAVEDSFSLHYAVQNQETTIPCRPTMPDIEVKLINYPNYNITYEFNPKTGFTFVVSKFKFQGQYYCCFKHPGQKSLQIPLYLEIDPAIPYLPTPFINDLSQNHTDVGQTLNLTCSIQESSSSISFLWKTPRGNFKPHNNEEDVKVVSSKNIIDGVSFLESNLTIRNANINDSGSYICNVFDRQNHSESASANIFIQSIEDCYLEIREENQLFSLTVNAGQTIQWILDVIAHPLPELTWYNNKGNIIKNDMQYQTSMVGEKAMLKIHNVHIEHSGEYKLQGISRRQHETQTCPQKTEVILTLNVTDKPSICLTRPNGFCKPGGSESPYIYLVNDMAYIECKATGNPLPKVWWEKEICVDTKCEFIQVSDPENTTYSDSTFTTKSYLNINTTSDGLVKCHAINRLGNEESTLSYFISDVKDGFDVIDFTYGSLVTTNHITFDVVVAANETFTFTCGVSPKKSEVLEILINDEPFYQISYEKYDLMVSKSELSLKKTIILRKVQFSDSGTYSCRVKNIYDQLYDYRNITLNVQAPEEPVIEYTNLKSDLVVDYPKMETILMCYVSGIPKPVVTWYKGKDVLKSSDRILLKDDGQRVVFQQTEISDEDVYKCEASNSVGTTNTEAFLKITFKPASFIKYYILIAITVIMLFIAIIYIIIRLKKEKALEKKLKQLGLQNFHKGNPENLNPELGIDDQAELLPYNDKFEFPIEHLKIGKQLGSGAFGIVLKADAKGIVLGEPKTTVAVKMVKKTADPAYIKALASELKIMVHLGKHINVVNLLGACTKNVANRELLVIVEYCRFGNLQHYIYKHRPNYINQVDDTGKVNYHIGADILERSYSSSSETYNTRTNTVSIGTDYHERTRTFSTQLSCTGDESVIMSNNSMQPEWRFNYRGDYRGDVRPICTRDLLAWSFQVVRGMEYLASRKVLHGDLAARNILLSENNIVKICDFGLAKTMYNDNNYKKRGNSPLPIKWMAIESIRDRVFSTQSDVWSFGIVLWEFFSLAEIPYPGMEADERLYNKLLEGYRMESPKYAPTEIYKIILTCWDAKPSRRPSFTNLADQIGHLLEDSVKKYYIDLNDPYLRMNTEKLETEDYLAMLSPPSFDVISSPTVHYENSEVFACNNSNSPSNIFVPVGYVPMRPTTIFSPKVQPSNVFNFQIIKNSDNGDANNEQLDGKTGYLVPITPVNSISNPMYHQFTKVNNIDKSPSENEKLILHTAENYIPIQQYKNIILLENTAGSRDSGNSSPIHVDVSKCASQVLYINDPSLWTSQQ